MSEIRHKALEKISVRANGSMKSQSETSSKKISEIFGKNVFDMNKMKEYLSEGAYEAIVAARQFNTKIDITTAESIAT